MLWCKILHSPLTSVNIVSSDWLATWVTRLKTLHCHDAKSVVSGGIGGCRYDNLRCRRWRQIRHHANSKVSVRVCLQPVPQQGQSQKRKDDTWSHGHGKVVTLITSSSLEMLKAANRHKLDLQRLEKATQYQADEYMSLFLTYRWLGARLQYLQCVSNGDTAVLH